MLPSIANQSEVTMTSLDFLNNIINPARENAGQKPVQNTDFIARVMDECELPHSEIFVVRNARGRSQGCINLSYDQMMLVGMRESKAVRKSVLAKLKELQAPQQDPALVLAHKVIEQAAQIEHLEKTKAQINDKRTATIMGKLGNATKKIRSLESQLQDTGDYRSLMAAKLPQRIDTEFKSNVQTWRVLKRISDDLGKDIRKVDDPRYGTVNTYHIKVIDKFIYEYM